MANQEARSTLIF